MTFEEFKKTCFHTKDLLKIPLLHISISKVENLMKKGNYDFDKENVILRRLYEEKNLENK